MGISLENLEAFVTAVDAGSFSPAARRMGKAQSRVSTAIGNLEIDLGVTLFDRSGKYPVLTPEGEALLRESRQIINRCRALRGLGWGAIAEYLVRDDIRAGHLVKLPLTFGNCPFTCNIYLVWEKGRRLRNAGTWLADAFTEALRGNVY